MCQAGLVELLPLVPGVPRLAEAGYQGLSAQPAGAVLTPRPARRKNQFPVFPAVAAILVGWAVAQYPYLLVPEVTIEEAAGGRATLVAMLVALVGGSLILVPALVYLYVLFQRSQPNVSSTPSGPPSRSAPTS